MIAVSFGAMGTDVTVMAPDQPTADAVRTRFDRAERRLSRFLPESELSIVNRLEREHTIVSPPFAAVLEAADRVRSITGGFVDAGVGSAVVAWGYDTTFAEVENRDRAPTTTLPGRPGWSIDGRVLRRDPGVRLDLGGVAKGWTCDRAVEADGALVVNAGGDVRSADPTLLVDIADPWGATAVTVRLGIGALATSSVAKRRWLVAGEPAHHLIDPRTMSPASSPILAATAITNAAIDAEAAAKTILLLGAEGLAWADRTEWVRAAVVVWHDGSVYATSRLEVAA